MWFFSTSPGGVREGNRKSILHTNDWFLTNRGTGWISEKEETGSGVRDCEVQVQNLDSILAAKESIGIVKIDVQGYELDLLRGMPRLLERGAVRDIVFEEEASIPAPTHEYLKSFGYSIFGLEGLFAGVRSLPDAQPWFDPKWGPVPNYLATRDANRAKARLRPTPWRSFGVGRLLG